MTEPFTYCHSEGLACGHLFHVDALAERLTLPSYVKASAAAPKVETSQALTVTEARALFHRLDNLLKRLKLRCEEVQQLFVVSNDVVDILEGAFDHLGNRLLGVLQLLFQFMRFIGVEQVRGKCDCSA